MGSKKITAGERYAGCVDDEAYLKAAIAQRDSIIEEAAVWTAIQIALMLAQRQSTGAIADMQAALANRRLTMAQEAVEHAKKTWDKEREFVTETMSEGVHTPQYGGADTILSNIGACENKAVSSAETTLARFGVAVDATTDIRIKRGIATARTDLVSHSMRAAEGRSIALNDRRYSRMLAAVGVGRGKLQNAQALGRLGDGSTAVRDSLLSTINSGMTLWGYASNRWRQSEPYTAGVTGLPDILSKYSVTGPVQALAYNEESPRVMPYDSATAPFAASSTIDYAEQYRRQGIGLGDANG